MCFAQKLAFLLIVSFAATLSALAYEPPSNFEGIYSYQTDIDLDLTGGALVTETIQARVLGIKMKRGIIRDIPVRYYDPLTDSARAPVKLQLVSVEQDGQSVRYKEEEQRNIVRLYVGGKLLEPGNYEFKLRYRLTSPVTTKGAKKDLYINPITEGLETNVHEVVVNVQLPDGTRMNTANAKIFLGETLANDRFSQSQQDNLISFTNNSPLSLPHGLMTRVTWQR